MVYHGILNIVPCARQWDLFTHPVNNSLPLPLTPVAISSPKQRTMNLIQRVGWEV